MGLLCNNCLIHIGNLICQGCYSTRYCSKICQKEHWKTHKKLCQSQQINFTDKEKYIEKKMLNTYRKTPELSLKAYTLISNEVYEEYCNKIIQPENGNDNKMIVLFLLFDDEGTFVRSYVSEIFNINSYNLGTSYLKKDNRLICLFNEKHQIYKFITKHYVPITGSILENTINAINASKNKKDKLVIRINKK